MAESRRGFSSSTDFQSTSEISLTVLGRAGSHRGDERMRRLHVQTAWDRAVGFRLRGSARPAGYSSGRLMVQVRDAAWKSELQKLRPEILVKMARLLPDGAIRRIEFRVDGGEFQADALSSSERNDAAQLRGPLEENPGAMPLDKRFQKVMTRYLSGAGK